ncbi:MAG: hypothetical protein HONBIEJF_00789 [Fimbriimonadaceae bacterium]|nr:hypothetical protein [Fimbriimonadaceae bacterium]
MFHRWLDLLFLHIAVPPEQLQRLIPPCLTVDTYPDASGKPMGWLGLVAFRMRAIRPRGLPPIPFLSAFPETNVRTYVHRDGAEPGVWFFSLDARPKLACRIARWWYREPYTQAEMYCRRDGDRITYRTKRLEGASAQCELVCQAGDWLGPSQPGSLEYFLTERYQLYTGSRSHIWKARVSHPPYRLREAEILACRNEMFEPLGFQPKTWDHVCFCDGVDTEVFRLQHIYLGSTT